MWQTSLSRKRFLQRFCAVNQGKLSYIFTQNVKQMWLSVQHLNTQNDKPIFGFSFITFVKACNLFIGVLETTHTFITQKECFMFFIMKLELWLLLPMKLEKGPQ